MMRMFSGAKRTEKDAYGKVKKLTLATPTLMSHSSYKSAAHIKRSLKGQGRKQQSNGAGSLVRRRANKISLMQSPNQSNFEYINKTSLNCQKDTNENDKIRNA